MKKTKISNTAGMLMLAFTGSLVPCGAAPIISEDFESTAAGQPAMVLVNGNAQVTGLKPAANTGIVSTQIVSGGLQILDDDAGVTDSTAGYEVDVVANGLSSPVSNLHVSFDIAWTDLSGSSVVNGTDAFRMAFGEYGGSSSLKTGSLDNRFFTVAFQNDGDISWAGTNSSLTSGTSASVEVFANDSDTETISYTSPLSGTEMLGPNEVDLWVNGSLLGTGALEDNNGGSPIPLAGDYNIGRFGFTSFSSAQGLSYVIDNMVIEEIVESPVLLFETFESNTVGVKPPSPPAVRSSPNNPEIFDEVIPGSDPEDYFLDNLYVLVIDDAGTVVVDGTPRNNLAGTGKGVEIRDEKDSNGADDYLPTTTPTQGSSGLGWQLVGSLEEQVSTLMFSMDFTLEDTGFDFPVYFGIANITDHMGSSSNRDLSARFMSDDAGLFFQTDDSGSDSAYNLVEGQSYELTVYLNDMDNESVTYKDPTGIIRLLAPNSGAFYIDGNLVGTEDFRDQGADGDPLYPGDNNIGRVGFATGTADRTPTLTIDNLLASEIVPATGTPVLYAQNFDTFVPDGAVPVPPGGKSKNATVVTGSANAAGGGTGNGMRMVDILGGSGEGSDFDFDFATVGNVHISLDAAWSDLMPATPADPSHRFKIRVGQSGKLMSSGARSYFDVGLSAVGVLEFPESAVEGKPTLQLTSGTAIHIDLFVNDNDTNSVDYEIPGGGTATLPAESWAIYVDGAFLFQDVFDSVTDPITGTAGDATLGRFGIVSSSADIDLEYTFDNIVITEIPEVSTGPETLGPVTIVVSQPDTVNLTFPCVIGNEYEVFRSAPGLDNFQSVGTFTADTNPDTFTYTGALGDKAFFQIQDNGAP